MQPSILTFTGQLFDFEAIGSSPIVIEDIAHALSQTCRFNGHCKRFYSVAEHSLLLSQYLDPEPGWLPLWGLLHDAAEAYVGDVVAPLKMVAGMTGYRELEGMVNDRVLRHFGIPHRRNPKKREAIRALDIALCKTEMRVLMVRNDFEEFAHIEELPVEIWNLPPQDAEAAFLDRFHDLHGTDFMDRGRA